MKVRSLAKNLAMTPKIFCVAGSSGSGNCMRVTVNAATDGKSHSVSPVSPVKVDLGRIKAPHAWADRLRFSMVVALSLGLHVALALMLATQAKVKQIEEAIPVEVIVEQPAEAQAPEEAPHEEITKPIEEAPAIEEEPASDFARSTDQDREDGKASEQAVEETKPPPPQLEAAPEAPSDPAPVAKPIDTPALRFSGFEPLPDFQFKELPARRSEGPSGKAEPGYLSTLYGLIMRKMPPLPKETRSARGRVTFGIQSNGRIFQETIAIPSGSTFLDAAALAAVRRASPFPAPPKGAPVYMRFDYGSD